MDDAELILAAYQQWGDCLPDHLVGDYAFVLLDRQQGKIVACRDHIGVKHLYFLPVEVGGKFIFSSNLNMLRLRAASANILNIEYLIDYLDNEVPPPTSTVYANIHQLAPASCLVLNSTSMEVRQYWQPKIGRKLKGSAESVPKFRELLTEVIRSRLPHTGKIGQLFSGGLDSSLVLYTLLPLCRERQEIPSLFSYVANSPTSPDNDWHYITLCSEDTGLQGRICGDGEPCLTRAELEQFFNRRGTFAWTPFLNRIQPLLDLVAAEPPACIFSGVGGDEIVTLSPKHSLIFMLLTGEWRRLVRSLAIRRQQAQLGWLHALARWLVFPFLPAKIQTIYAKLRRKSLAMADYRGSFLRQDLGGQGPSIRKSSSDVTGWRQFDPRNEILATINSGYFTQAMAMADANSEIMGCPYSMPLLDKRIIEFCLAMPGDEFVMDGTPRIFARNVMRGIVPDEICNRMSKTLVGALDVELLLANEALFAEITSKESEMAWRILDRDKMGTGFAMLQGLATTSKQARQLGYELSKCLNVAAFIQWFEKQA